jgi:hypothetical protein
MFELISLWLRTLIRAFCNRGDLMLENLALRQQLAVLKRKHPRASLRPIDKLFWVVAGRFLSLERDARSGPARDGCSLAPCGIQSVLDHAVQSTQTSRRRPENFKRDS